MTSLNSREEEKGEGTPGSLESRPVNDSEPTRPDGGKAIGPKHDEPIQPDDGKAIRPGHDETIHLRPTATLAERVLLPGDPGRALALAQFLLEDPLMFNHHRGLWGYTGRAADGEPLTVQSTGMGGPSAAIVLHELISLGVRRAIRVGTCGALDPSLRLGDLVLAREAMAADGTSQALGAGKRVAANPVLADALAIQLERLCGPLDEQGADQPGPAGHEGRVASPGSPAGRRGRAGHEGCIASTDLFYEGDSSRNADWSAGGAIAVEMEAAALFAVGGAAGIQVACLLAVTDVFDEEGGRGRIDDHALVGAVETMGTAAAAALSV
jgi:uridine phosphorylase